MPKMYVPKINRLDDREAILEFMQRFSFATLVTAEGDLPLATHLPFLARLEGETLILTSHLAKANAQWEHLQKKPVLVIFSEPHAYISPTNYTRKLNVPTWNYTAVHAYGQANLVTETDAVIRLLEATMDNYEPYFREQWLSLPEAYKVNLTTELVAFEVRVTEVQGKEKLSQDKSLVERQNIVRSLESSDSSSAQLIAEYMRKKM